jgi:hypothetical protein
MRGGVEGEIVVEEDTRRFSFLKMPRKIKSSVAIKGKN